MVVIETQEQLEMFAWDVKQNMPYLPENFRLLIIMEPEAFDKMVGNFIVGSKVEQMEKDRFIYHSHAGIEFGVKKGSNG